jgi:hypothetical protein
MQPSAVITIQEFPKSGSGLFLKNSSGHYFTEFPSCTLGVGAGAHQAFTKMLPNEFRSSILGFSPSFFASWKAIEILMWKNT